MDLNGIFESCNKVKIMLKQGFDKYGDVKWLNNICKELSKLFGNIEKYLEHADESDKAAINRSFVSIVQIVCCIKYLKKIIESEKQDNSTMTLSRKYFINRLDWCIEQLKLLISCSMDDITFSSNFQNNFVNSMDSVLDLLSPHTFNFRNGNSYLEDTNSSLNLSNLKEIITNILEHTLSFASIALDIDKIPLRVLCEKVFIEFLTMEKEHLSNDKFDLSFQLKATALECALNNLERLVNECLLRLVYTVFVDIKNNPIKSLREMCIAKSSQVLIDEKIGKYDEISDRLLQIGFFAASFAACDILESQILSSITSIESLDSFLISSLQNEYKRHSELLEMHWLDEISILKSGIQNIIDTSAFAGCLISILEYGIESIFKDYNSDKIKYLLEKCEIFVEHLQINHKELTKKANAKPNLDNFKLMIVECNAAILVCTANEHHRVIKRLRVLLSELKKFQKSFDSNQLNEFTFGDVTSPASLQNIKIKIPTDSCRQINSNDLNSDERSVAKNTLNELSLNVSSRPSFFNKSHCSKNTIIFRSTGNNLIINARQIASSKRWISQNSSLRTTVFKKSIEEKTLKLKTLYNDHGEIFHSVNCLNIIEI